MYMKGNWCIFYFFKLFIKVETLLVVLTECAHQNTPVMGASSGR